MFLIPKAADTTTPWRGDNWQKLRHVCLCWRDFTACKVEFGIPKITDEQFSSVRDTVLKSAAAVEGLAQSVVRERAEDVGAGIAQDLAAATTALAEINGGNKDGSRWTTAAPAGCDLDTLLSVAAETLLKAPVGKIKARETEVFELMSKLVDAENLMSVVADFTVERERATVQLLKTKVCTKGSTVRRDVYSQF